MLQNHIDNMKHQIRPSDFFSSGHEKTKLNWFLYEYALELHSYINRDKILHGKLTRRNINSAMIAAFCVSHALLVVYRRRTKKRLCSMIHIIIRKNKAEPGNGANGHCINIVFYSIRGAASLILI